MKQIRWQFVCTAWFVLLGYLDAAQAADKTITRTPSVKDALPPIGTKLNDIHLSDFQGKVWNVGSTENRKAVVLAFLGVQCPLAKLYTAKLVDLEKKYADRGVLFIAVDSNVQDSLAEMASHARKFGIEFPFLKDPSQNLAVEAGVTRTPEVCVLDGSLKIRYRGRIDDQYGIGYSKEAAAKTELIDSLEAIIRGDDIGVTTSPAQGCLIGRSPRGSQEEDSKSEVTYSKQISRILQERCVACHRPGEIGPMDLSNYEDASAWADMIAEVVKEQRMPPWHASPEHGQFANDRRMPQDEIKTLVSWAHSGSPRGNVSDEPSPLRFAEGWQLPSEPNLIVPMSDKPFDVPARGDVKYQYFVADPKLTEDTWVNGMEIVPGNRAVVHHILVFVREKGQKKLATDAERGFLVGYVPGTRVEMMPQGMAKRIPANSELVFQVHYTPNGTQQSDLSKVGFWFAKKDSITHEVQTTSAVQPNLRIPPNEPNYKTTALQPEELPACDLLSMSPHMHVRGKSFRYTAVLPNGDREILIDVPKYDFNWQTEYRLKEKRYLPAGTRMFCEATFDNSEENLNNPNPKAWVHWGDQTYEEMMIGYFHIAIPIDPKLGRAQDMHKAPKAAPSAMQIFLALDTDGNGKLSKDDVPKRLVPMFDKLDKNKDGVLEKSEVPN